MKLKTFCAMGLILAAASASAGFNVSDVSTLQQASSVFKVAYVLSDAADEISVSLVNSAGQEFALSGSDFVSPPTQAKGAGSAVFDISRVFPEKAEDFSVKVSVSRRKPELDDAAQWMRIDLKTYSVTKGTSKASGDDKVDGLVLRRVKSDELGDYYMGVYEVTQGQWENVMGTEATQWAYPGAKNPANNVSYDLVRGVDSAVSASSFLGVLQSGTGYCIDLPTEAQWWNACDGSFSPDVAWYSGNAKSLAEVGTRRPNGHGLYDMYGNASEWCLPTETEGGAEYALLGGNFMRDLTSSQAKLRETGTGAAAVRGFRVMCPVGEAGRGVIIEKDTASAAATYDAGIYRDLSGVTDFGLDRIPESVRQSLGLSYDENGFMIYQGWLLDYDRENRGNVESARIPDGVVGIGHGAMGNLFRLSDLTLPASLKYVTAGAFEGDCSLQAVELGENVETIGDRAFADCVELSEVSLDDGLRTIGSGAFENCWDALETIALPLGIESVASNAFDGCDCLSSVAMGTHRGTLADWFGETAAQITDVEILPGETEIVAGAFSNCTSLARVVIPEGVTEIGDNAFCGCVSLEEIALPDSLVSLGAAAFAGDERIQSVTLPDGLTNLPDRVFSKCGLTTLTVPASVRYLGESFCPATVTDIYYLGNAPEYAAGAYAETQPSLVSHVSSASTGWDGRAGSPGKVREWPKTADSRKVSYDDLPAIRVGFNANGGEFRPTDELAFEVFECDADVGDTYPVPAYAPVRDGYAFNGWWTTKSGGSEVTFETAVSKSSAHEVYAHWVKVAPITIRLDANGGRVDPTSVLLLPDMAFGQLPVPARQHYSFQGWWTALDGGVRITADSKVEKDMVCLYARWAPAVYKIVYHKNFGDGSYVESEFEWDEITFIDYETFDGMDKILPKDAEIMDDADYWVTNHVFAGWMPAQESDIRYASGSTLRLRDVPGSVINEDGIAEQGRIDFWASWLPYAYSVRFDANGGEGTMEPLTCPSDVDVLLPANRFTHGDWQFAGWSLSPRGASPFVGDGGCIRGLSRDNGGVVTLYAIWVDSGSKAVKFALRKAAGGDSTSLATALNSPTGKPGANGEQQTVWDEYVAGTDPADEKSKFEVSIAFEDGKPVLSWSPDLNNGNPNGTERTYTIWGSRDLKTWERVPEGRETDYSCFRVSVRLPER